MSVAKKPRPKLRRWGRGPNPLILKRRPRRDPEPPEPSRSGLADFRVERAAYTRARAELMEKYPGKFVVFVREDMLGPFDSFEQAIRAARQKHGRIPIFTKELTEGADVAYS